MTRKILTISKNVICTKKTGLTVLRGWVRIESPSEEGSKQSPGSKMISFRKPHRKMTLKSIRMTVLADAAQNPSQAPVLTLQEGKALEKLKALPAMAERMETQSSEQIALWFAGELNKAHSAEFVEKFLEGLRELVRNEVAMEVIYRYLQIMDSEKHFQNAQRKYQDFWLEFLSPDQLRQLVKEICYEKQWFVEEEGVQYAS